jgi:hypothetical protein
VFPFFNLFTLSNQGRIYFANFIEYNDWKYSMRLRWKVQNERGLALLSGFADTMFDRLTRFRQLTEERIFKPQLHGAMPRSASIVHNCQSL